MVFPVAGQDGNLNPFDAAAGQWGRWTAVRGGYFQFIAVLQNIWVIETRAADYTDLYHYIYPFGFIWLDFLTERQVN